MFVVTTKIIEAQAHMVFTCVICATYKHWTTIQLVTNLNTSIFGVLDSLVNNLQEAQFVLLNCSFIDLSPSVFEAQVVK